MRTAMISLALSILLTPAAHAQAREYANIVVTGARAERALPAVFLERRGDFLLLEVRVENDTRDINTRLSEMSATLSAMREQAEAAPAIELSLVDDNDLVRPLTADNWRRGIGPGGRPDTSVTYVRVKTPIPEEVESSFELTDRLGAFVSAVETTGRTELIASDAIDVSIVDPQQYRGELIERIGDDMRRVTQAMGGDYRVVAKGLDRSIEWVRVSDIDLAIYLPYSFDVVPRSFTSYLRAN
ncbi:MAG: hypothetical protein MI723_16370 [Caulobacterales bacterium]|nr:hypothetical protein [Caulobacterales bacterium]